MRRFLTVMSILVLVVAVGIGIARATTRPIDGVSCDFLEASTYHVHAHLAIVVRGRVVAGPPTGTGIHVEHLCLYWLHTHDTSGIIHIEAPHRFSPSLRNFFDIWGQPLTRRHVAGYSLGSGQRLRVYVGPTIFTGNPRAIPLYERTKVTIEVGPPFISPPAVNWHGL